MQKDLWMSMTTSYGLNQSTHSERISQHSTSPTKNSRYRCYTCGGNSLRSQACITCNGSQEVGDDNFLVGLLMQVMGSKLGASKPTIQQFPQLRHTVGRKDKSGVNQVTVQGRDSTDSDLKSNRSMHAKNRILNHSRDNYSEGNSLNQSMSNSLDSSIDSMDSSGHEGSLRTKPQKNRHLANNHEKQRKPNNEIPAPIKQETLASEQTSVACQKCQKLFRLGQQYMKCKVCSHYNICVSCYQHGLTEAAAKKQGPGSPLYMKKAKTELEKQDAELKQPESWDDQVHEHPLTACVYQQDLSQEDRAREKRLKQPDYFLEKIDGVQGYAEEEGNNSEVEEYGGTYGSPENTMKIKKKESYQKLKETMKLSETAKKENLLTVTRIETIAEENQSPSPSQKSLPLSPKVQQKDSSREEEEEDGYPELPAPNLNKKDSKYKQASTQNMRIESEGNLEKNISIAVSNEIESPGIRRNISMEFDRNSEQIQMRLSSYNMEQIPSIYGAVLETGDNLLKHYNIPRDSSEWSDSSRVQRDDTLRDQNKWEVKQGDGQEVMPHQEQSESRVLNSDEKSIKSNRQSYLESDLMCSVEESKKQKERNYSDTKEHKFANLHVDKKQKLGDQFIDQRIWALDDNDVQFASPCNLFGANFAPGKERNQENNKIIEDKQKGLYSAPSNAESVKNSSAEQQLDQIKLSIQKKNSLFSGQSTIQARQQTQAAFSFRPSQIPSFETKRSSQSEIPSNCKKYCSECAREILSNNKFLKCKTCQKESIEFIICDHCKINLVHRTDSPFKHEFKPYLHIYQNRPEKNSDNKDIKMHKAGNSMQATQYGRLSIAPCDNLFSYDNGKKRQEIVHDDHQPVRKVVYGQSLTESYSYEESEKIKEEQKPKDNEVKDLMHITESLQLKIVEGSPIKNQKIVMGQTIDKQSPKEINMDDSVNNSEVFSYNGRNFLQNIDYSPNRQSIFDQPSRDSENVLIEGFQVLSKQERQLHCSTNISQFKNSLNSGYEEEDTCFENEIGTAKSIYTKGKQPRVSINSQSVINRLNAENQTANTLCRPQSPTRNESPNRSQYSSRIQVDCGDSDAEADNYGHPGHSDQLKKSQEIAQEDHVRHSTEYDDDTSPASYDHNYMTSGVIYEPKPERDKKITFNLLDNVCPLDRSEKLERSQCESDYSRQNLKQNSTIYYKLNDKYSKEPAFVFEHYNCDMCAQKPQNYRYHCRRCENYDLCKQCYARVSQLHDHGPADFEEVSGSQQLQLEQQREMQQKKKLDKVLQKLPAKVVCLDSGLGRRQGEQFFSSSTRSSMPARNSLNLRQSNVPLFSSGVFFVSQWR